jgi:hypothetical protein
LARPQKEMEENVVEKRLILRKKHCFCKKYSSQRTSFKKKCLSLQADIVIVR